MRFLLYLLLIGGVAGQTPLSSIDGIIVNQLTGDPLRGVRVILKSATGNTFTGESGPNGSYNLQRLDPGSYTLSAERAGFLPLSYGSKRSGQKGAAIVLMSGQKLDGIDFKLQPYGVVAGRILDADGDPLFAASVTAMKLTYVNGKKEFKAAETSMRNPPLTNDLGEYRIAGLSPGTYYIRAAPRGADGSAVNFVATFYPAATETERATALTITPGKVITGIDVKLLRLPAVSIRGRVNNLTGVTGNVSVVLFPDVLGTASGNAQAKPDGRFELPGVVPGRYWLLARLPAGNESYQTKLAVDVAGQTVDDVVMTIDKGVSISGHVTLEPNANQMGSLRSIRLSLNPAQASPIQRLFITPATQLEDDGSFHLENVPKDQYELSISGLPSGYYLKSAMLGDLDLRENSFNLKDSSTALQIVISGGTGRIEGTITRALGATVVLVPEGAKRRTRLDWYRTTTADHLGKFAISDIAPGDYKIFAWEDIEDGSWMDPNILGAVEVKGTKLSVREGRLETVAVESIRIDER